MKRSYALKATLEFISSREIHDPECDKAKKTVKELLDGY